MKANELRIGSLVYITDTSTQLFYKQETQINIHNLMYLCGETKEPFEFEIEPIPLTEDWLLKLGFKQVPKIKSEYYKHGISFDVKDNTCFIETDSTPEYFNHIKHVHQLQNLYFALTNEELR
jgi:hypothetical protein